MEEFHSAVQDNTLVLKNHTIAVTKNKMTHLQNIKSEFINGVIEQIKRRFPVDDTSVICALAKLGLRGISFVSSDQLQEHGAEEINLLCDTYGSLSEKPGVAAYVDKLSVKSEWALLKHLVLQQKYPTDNIFVLWKIIAKYHVDQFPNLIKLAELALIAPLQTADCERGFSTQNDIIFFYVFVMSCVCYVLCASVYMCFVVTCWERADLLALVCGVFCEFVTFPLVSWVRCGT